jgi:hypothetical protein
MGYLDHSTNNIILDAVLTDYGRQRLATANSAFNITHYSLGDDEVDYKLVKKFGRTVGKEKIEKNTPIFEALTNPNIALKYRLIGRENDGTSISTVYLPVLQSSTSGLALLESQKTSDSVKIDLYYNKVTGNGVPVEFLQSVYKIKVSDRFFTIEAGTGGSLTKEDVSNASDPNRTTTYTYTFSGRAQTQFTFTVKAKNIDRTTLSVYGKRISDTSKRQISSYVTVIGERHGCSIDIPVTYTATLT